MKKIIFLFALLFSLASFNLDAISLEHKGGAVQVIIGKQGQAIYSFELPTKYAKPNGKYCYDATIAIVDANGHTVLYLMTDQYDIDVSMLKKGNYTLYFELLDFSIQKAIIL